MGLGSDVGTIVSCVAGFLVKKRGTSMLTDLINCASSPGGFSHCHMIVVPSPFFQSRICKATRSVPGLPLRRVRNVPLLFNSPGVR